MGHTLVAIVSGLVTAIGIVLSGIQAYASHKDILADKTNKKALRNYRIFIMCIIVLAAVGGSATVSASYSPTNSNGPSVTPTPSVVGVTPTPSVVGVTPTPSVVGVTPTPAPTEAQSISLASLEPIQGTAPVDTDPADLGGKTYLDLVRQDLYNCNKWQTDYDLGKKYRIFTAQAGLSDKYVTTSTPWIFAIYSVEANGQRTLFKQLMKFGQVANVSVTVSGVVRLRLSIEWTNSDPSVTCGPYASYDAIWANPKLIS